MQLYGGLGCERKLQRRYGDDDGTHLRMNVAEDVGDSFTVEGNRMRREKMSLVRPERFELPTLWFEAKCSIQLSYGRLPEEA